MAGGLRLTRTLDRQASLFPDRVALVDDGRAISFNQCIEDVAALAGGLCADGLQPGEKVAVLAFNSARLVQLIYAIFRTGGVAVLLNWRWAAPELARAMADSEAAVLVVDRDHADKGRWAASFCTGLRSVVPLETLGDEPRANDGGDGDAALIVYPDGDDHFPDAVVYGHERLMTLAVRDAADGPASVSPYLLQTPLFEPAACLWMFNVLAHGHRLIVSRQFEPRTLAATAGSHAVTDIGLTSQMALMLLRGTDIHSSDFATVRRLHIQTAGLPAYAIRTLADKFPALRVVARLEPS